MKKTSNKVIVAAIVSVTVFTVAAFVLQFVGEAEISSTLTTCWFGFWTVELGALAGIKICKTRFHKDE